MRGLYARKKESKRDQQERENGMREIQLRRIVSAERGLMSPMSKKPAWYNVLGRKDKRLFSRKGKEEGNEEARACRGIHSIFETANRRRK